MHDKELGSIGVWTSICHRQRSTRVLTGDCLIVETVAWTTTTGSRWIAALNHKALDDAVEDDIVIKTFACEENEVVYGHWRLGCIQLELHCSSNGFNRRGIGLGQIDAQRGWRCVLLIAHVHIVTDECTSIYCRLRTLLPRSWYCKADERSRVHACRTKCVDCE